jgi:hypothetical protein
MTAVTPRVIAYIACQVSSTLSLSEYIGSGPLQVRFALSSLGEWGKMDGLFSMIDFFMFIVDKFEYETGPWAKETLEFWNKYIFPVLFHTS